MSVNFAGYTTQSELISSSIFSMSNTISQQMSNASIAVSTTKAMCATMALYSIFQISSPLSIFALGFTSRDRAPETRAVRDTTVVWGKLGFFDDFFFRLFSFYVGGAPPAIVLSAGCQACAVEEGGHHGPLCGVM